MSCAVFGAFAGGGGGGGTVLGEGPPELEAACVGVEVGGAPRRGALTGLLQMRHGIENWDDKSEGGRSGQLI